MITRLRTLGVRLFPERQVLLRSERGVHHVTLTGWLQGTLVGGALGVAGAVGYIAVGSMGGQHLSTEKAGEANAAEPGASSSAALDVLRNQLAETTTALQEAHGELAAANARLEEVQGQLAASGAQTGELSGSLNHEERRAAALEEARDDLELRLRAAEQSVGTKSGLAAQSAKNAEESRAELRRAEAQRSALHNRAQLLQAELDAANARAKDLRAALDKREREMQQLAMERDRLRSAVQEQAAIKVQPARLLAEVAAPGDVVAAAMPAPLPIAKAEGGRLRDGAGDLERLIVSTGLSIERLVGHLGAAPTGQGGPYVALDGAGRVAQADAKRVEELQKVVKTLPLAAPLNGHYQVESLFGSRSDPINGRKSFHSGLDLSAPYKTPVLTTAPGVVVFTGAKDDYGKVVEVDHGHGIVTRYAHLHRILVARGQKISARQEIGELGSTGRTTGPHVHYEILIDGTSQDPEKFMQAGKNVVQISKK